jgi:hypothetical protein
MSGAPAFRVLGPACLLLAAGLSARAGDATTADCFEDKVLLHVREQFAIYGPRSSQYEYFGFIYRKDGLVESAITHDFECRGQTECVVNTAFALKRIPKGAKVLGEWHTHPHFHEADALSPEDVRGAQANRHIRCYTAFYSSHDGEIYRWNLDAPTVAAAMASRTWIGNYRVSDARPDSKLADNSGASVVAIIAAPDFPGSTCLSTSTNAPTADTTKKSCRRSPTNR